MLFSSNFSYNGCDYMNSLDSYDYIFGILENKAIDILKKFYGRPNPNTNEL